MTQSKPQAPRRRHHFIPKFLLDRWTGRDGELVRYFRRGDGVIDRKRSSPGGVAYEDWLYETAGFPPEHAQQMEQKFFAPIDDKAAKAHDLLAAKRGNELTEAMACDWARLIMSIWFRTPGDTKGLGNAIASLADPSTSKRVMGMPTPPDFPPEAFSQLQMQAIRMAIDDPERGRALIGMHWGTVDLPSPRRFMISDWPLQTARDLPFLGHPGSYIVMPLTPSRLFAAACSPRFLPALGALPPRELEQRVNYAVVSQARSFVGATCEKAEVFVEKNFACEGRPSVAKTIAQAFGV